MPQPKWIKPRLWPFLSASERAAWLLSLRNRQTGSNSAIMRGATARPSAAPPIDTASSLVGWSDPEGTRPFLGSDLLGFHDDDGRLLYAGRVGTGMSQETLALHHRRLKPLKTNQPAK